MNTPERDPYTGIMTTGHEWNGIKELNTQVPRPVIFFLALTTLCAIILWVLFPAWPYGTGYTPGILGVDQYTMIAEDMDRSAVLRQEQEQRFSATGLEALETDNKAMTFVRSHGARLFADNCAVCHGAAGGGGPGFPRLSDNQWLWGGSLDAILETLRVGINSAHDETRYGEMPAFGDDETLGPDEIMAVTAYVISLSQPDDNGSDNPSLAQSGRLVAGAEIFSENCAACHGDNGRGNQDLGAPNLTDTFWIYGNGPENIAATIQHGRAGVMPYWEDRLSETDRRVLALYVRDLSAWSR